MKKQRTIFFFDGFNIYHSIDEKLSCHKYKWLDYYKLANQLISSKTETIANVYYFTALCTWNDEKRDRHKKLIKANENNGVSVVYGVFRSRSRTCFNCKKTYRSPVEKRTDVNIAMHLVKLAIQNKYDTGIIVSGDADLIPAISTVKELFPSKRIGIIFPINRKFNYNEINSVADFVDEIRLKHLKYSRFPDEVVLKNGTILNCPSNWL